MVRAAATMAPSGAGWLLPTHRDRGNARARLSLCSAAPPAPDLVRVQARCTWARCRPDMGGVSGWWCKQRSPRRPAVLGGCCRPTGTMKTPGLVSLLPSGGMMAPPLPDVVRPGQCPVAGDHRTLPRGRMALGRAVRLPQGVATRHSASLPAPLRMGSDHGAAPPGLSSTSTTAHCGAMPHACSARGTALEQCSRSNSRV